MNFKTTLYLAVALVVVVALVWLAGPQRQADEGPPPKVTELLTDKPLIPDDFGQVVKLTCARRDGQVWTFQRTEQEDDPDASDWNMTAPLQAKAANWQVDGIVRKLKGLTYQVKHQPDDPAAVTPADAGLEPPSAAVTLENERGTAVTVEVGRDVSDSQAYVRLGGSQDIYVVSTSLGKLLKDRPIEYRDQQLFDFQADNVKKLEIIDGSDSDAPATYALVRSDADWVFEAPTKARGVADKINSAVKAMSNLRVAGWVETQVDNPDMYGLGEAGLTIQATVEETPEPPEGKQEADESEGAEAEKPTDQEEAEEGEQEDQQPEPEPVITEYVLHLSRRSPIGEETKVYVAKAGDPSVGTVAKTTADRLTPDLVQWRDMRLTTAMVTTADRIELATPAASASFKLEDGRWVDAGTGSGIDADAVKELLKQLGDLKALSLVQIEEGDLEPFGLDQPQAEIRLNVPGEAQSQRFTVGAYTDPKTRRMVYVWADQADAVAKVRVGEVGTLIRPPAEYRDRTIFDLNSNQIERIAITRQDELTGEPFAFALVKTDEELRIAEPVAAATATAEVSKLVKALAELTAIRVVGDEDPATYGLDAPAVTCAITRQPPEITKYVQVEPDEGEVERAEPEKGQADELQAEEDQAQEGQDAEAEMPQPDTPAEASQDQAKETTEVDKPEPKMRVEKYKPPAEQYELLVSEHGGKVYATRTGPTIYEVERKLLKLLRGEYHDPAILDFEQSQVVSVTVTEPDDTAHTFAKVDDQWQYAPEPDLPIDPKKITDLLLRINDLETERYVVYGAADPAAYGLDAPWRSATVKLEDGSESGLVVSARICDADTEHRYYAAVVPEGDGVFLVSGDTIARFEIDLTEFEAP